MTDTIKLNEMINRSGLKKKHIAKELKLSNQALYNKLDGRSEFKLSEITILCNLLGVSKEIRDEIFFANDVEK